MSGYRTIEVIATEKDTTCRIPVEVSVEKQQRIRDDESTTRPFIKIKLVVGNRIVFCDVRQARALEEMILAILPDAEEALSKLTNGLDQSQRSLSPVDADLSVATDEPDRDDSYRKESGKRKPKRRIRFRRDCNHNEDY